MRSFAGVYFFLRFLPFLYYPCELYKIPFSFGSYLVLIFLSATLLIAIARPYKATYMNVFDILILGQLTFASKMLTDDYYDGMGTHLFLINLIPALALVICLFYVKVLKVYNLTRCCRRGVRNENCPLEDDFVNLMLENNGREGSETQPLLTSTSSVKNYSTNYDWENRYKSNSLIITCTLKIYEYIYIIVVLI